MALLARLRMALRALIRRGTMERDLEEELRLHVDREAERSLAAGLPADEANATARRAFGNVEGLKEQSRDARGVRWIESLQQDLRHGARTLAKSPGFTVVAIVSLGLGLGAVTTAYTYIDAIRLRALPYPEAARIVVVGDQAPSYEVARYTSFTAWGEGRRTIDAIAGIEGAAAVLALGTTSEVVVGAGVSPSYFGLLGVPLIAGRVFGPDENRLGAPAVIVISERLWRSKLGADPHLLGRALSIGSARPAVIGIVSARFHAPAYEHDYFVPIVPMVHDRQEQYAGAVAAGTVPKDYVVQVRVLARLALGSSRAQAEEELSATAAPDSIGRRHARVSSLRSVGVLSLHSYDLFLGVVALSVLLIACANLGGLLLVRQVARQREFAVRTALGAGTSRLMRQLATESALLTIVAGAMGALFAVWATEALRASALGLNALPMGLEPHIDARVFAFLLLLTCVCGATVTVIPARRVTRGDVQSSLRESALNASRGPRRARAQHAFVVAQLACASLLLGGAGIMVATYFKVSHLDLGFDPRSLAYVVVRPPGDPMHLPSDAEVKAFAPPIKARLASVPGVKGVGTWGFATSRASWNELLPLWEDTPEGRRRIPGAAARMVAADTGFLQVVGISLRKGRTFTSADGAGSPPVAIVDEQTAARWWPGMDAVGRRLRVGGDAEPWVTVVGVIASTRSLFWTLDLVDDRRTNVIIRPWVQSVVPEEAFFFVRSAAPDARLLVGALRRAILPVTAGAMLLSVAPKSADYEEIYAPMRANTLAMLMLAGSGLVLALIGVYGVVAYTVAQRTQEIGIRVALGAQRTDVLPLVMTSSVVMALTGLGIGVLATLALRQAIRAALHNASAAASPLGVAVASVVFLGVVLLASYLPARRATRVDPTTALRSG